MSVTYHEGQDHMVATVGPRVGLDLLTFVSIIGLGTAGLALYTQHYGLPIGAKAYVGAVWGCCVFYLGLTVFPQRETIRFNTEGLRAERGRFNPCLRGLYRFCPLEVIEDFRLVEPKQLKPAPETLRAYPLYLISTSPALVARIRTPNARVPFLFAFFATVKGRNFGDRSAADLVLAVQADAKEKGVICERLNDRLKAWKVEKSRV